MTLSPNYEANETIIIIIKQNTNNATTTAIATHEWLVSLTLI